MAGAVVGGAVLSAFLQVLFDRLAPRSIVDSISGRKHGQVILVKKLKTTLISAETVLNDAAVKQIVNPSVKEWLEELQDAAEDCRSLLEKISAEASQGRLGSRASRNKLEMILERLEYMMSQKDVLNLKELGEKLFNRSPTTSLVRESHIYGRDDDVENIVSMLLANDVTPDCLRTISIVGVAGIGKTTLAQHVNNDHRVKGSFNLNVWVCLSSESDTWTVTERIFEAVTGTNSGTKDLNRLQLRLKEEVSGKKLLLVLDDVRSENSLEWETLRSPFRLCAGQSVILVTSRSEGIAGTTYTLPPYHLNPLSYEDSWCIFAEHALESRYSNADPRLETIGREIVRKCSGLPGTTKALGIFLHSKADPDEWEKVLKHDLWYSSLDETEIFMTLKEETSRGIRKTEQRRIRRSPLLVDSMERSHQSTKRQIKMNVSYLILWIILLSVLSGLMFSVINNAHVMERKKTLGRLCDERAQMLQDQFTFSVNHIHALGMLLTRFYYSKNPLDRKQMQEFFSNYISTTVVLHPYLSRVAYAERVVNAERKEFERDHGWEIKTIHGACQEAPSPARDEYAPVIFATEPVSRIISWDIMSGKEDRKSILKARSTRPLGLSLPFSLVRSRYFGFVLTCPVYTSKLPPNTTQEQQVGATAGYIGAHLEFKSFTDNVLSQLDGNLTILVTVYDVTNSSKPLLMYGGGRYNGSDESLERELKLGDPSQKHKMVCRYHRKAPTSWTAIIASSSFFIIGLLLVCICWGAAFHVLATREVSRRIRRLEIRAEAANAANSQTPA